jgi:hypothetical protein
MRSKEVRTAAATCSTESPVVGVDVSWTSEVTGGAFRTLRPLPIAISATPQLKFVFTNITPIFRGSGVDFEF